MTPLHRFARKDKQPNVKIIDFWPVACYNLLRNPHKRLLASHGICFPHGYATKGTLHARRTKHILYNSFTTQYCHSRAQHGALALVWSAKLHPPTMGRGLHTGRAVAASGATSKGRRWHQSLV